MSTSDQQGHGPLTRKQLREIRLTGSTPVITPEEAAAAAAPPVPPLPRAAEPVEIAPAPTPEPPASSAPESDAGNGAVPLTRRQVRERERVTTESVPVAAEVPVEEAPTEEAPVEEAPTEVAPVEDALTEEAPAIVPIPTLPEAPALVTAVPAFTPPVPAEEPVPADEPVPAEDLDEDAEAEPAEDTDLPTPVSAAGVVDYDETTVDPETSAADAAAEEIESEPIQTEDAAEAVAALGIEVEPRDDVAETDDVLADVQDSDDQDIAEGERPTVNPAFGQELLSDPAEAKKPFVPSFDELLTVGDSTGSQHLAPNTLIFTPSAGDGSLSGPVASTGEILVTGSYELPKGLGSQGHAHGTTDGKDVDAVLIDGELAPASSPTPIAASSAVSTIKPAGEIIRPPAPEKGNKLMLILAIVAGGLALALGVALIVAFTTNVF